jgi:hypothetical protein
MPQGELPDDVYRFLQEHIRSIEQLEILLLLRDGAQRTWTPADVYQIVQSSERSVTDTLEALCRQGLIQKIEQPRLAYQFQPKDDSLKETVARVAELYSERRVRVVQAIYSDRTSAADEFAKAFRLRKDGNG